MAHCRAKTLFYFLAVEMIINLAFSQSHQIYSLLGFLMEIIRIEALKRLLTKEFFSVKLARFSCGIPGLLCLSRKTCASTCAVFLVLTFSNWVFPVSNWVFGFSDGIFARSNWDFRFLSWFFITLMYEGLVLKGFSAGCTKIDRWNWIYFGDLHKIAILFQFCCLHIEFLHFCEIE